jgi:hypothetical protein
MKFWTNIAKKNNVELYLNRKNQNIKKYESYLDTGKSYLKNSDKIKLYQSCLNLELKNGILRKEFIEKRSK